MFSFVESSDSLHGKRKKKKKKTLNLFQSQSNETGSRVRQTWIPPSVKPPRLSG
ncbi:uncharacterized protein J3R85_001188 [Psidium guajava]|nr:uncharacterized protein J3R85_001188 [Psidium guajava]